MTKAITRPRTRWSRPSVECSKTWASVSMLNTRTRFIHKWTTLKMLWILKNLIISDHFHLFASDRAQHSLGTESKGLVRVCCLFYYKMFQNEPRMLWKLDDFRLCLSEYWRRERERNWFFGFQTWVFIYRQIHIWKPAYYNNKFDKKLIEIFLFFLLLSKSKKKKQLFF